MPRSKPKVTRRSRPSAVSPALTTTTSSDRDGSSERAIVMKPASAAKAPLTWMCFDEVSMLPPPEAMTQRSGRCSNGRWLAAIWITPLRSPRRRRPFALTEPSRSAGTAAAARRSSGCTLRRTAELQFVEHDEVVLQVREQSSVLQAHPLLDPGDAQIGAAEPAGRGGAAGRALDAYGAGQVAAKADVCPQVIG